MIAFCLRERDLRKGQWHLRRNRVLVMGFPSIFGRKYLLQTIEGKVPQDDRVPIGTQWLLYADMDDPESSPFEGVGS